MKSVALALLLLAATPVLAQEQRTAILTMTGEGKAFVAPDTAVLHVGVSSTAATAREAMDSNARTMTQVTQALVTGGVKREDLQTENVSIYPVSNEPDPKSGKPRITTYQARNSLSVKVRDLGAVGDLIERANSVGANEVSGPMLIVENKAQAMADARRKAVEDARERAETYATALGLRLERVVHVAEGRESSAPPRPMMTLAQPAMGMRAAAPPVEAGLNELQAQVTITWEISKP